ncbi:MAG: hypothetical protein EA370_15810, partial [Wenzhouxiangella sp.]
MSRSAAADLRFVQIGTLALRIHDLDPAAVIAELARRRQQAPELLDSARLLLDLGQLDPESMDFAQVEHLAAALTEHGHQLLGLLESPASASLANRLGLPVLKASTERPARARKSRPEPEPEPEPEHSDWTATRHIDGQVRSGQQIY